jgi:CheY-like chemotaxis protein
MDTVRVLVISDDRAIVASIEELLSTSNTESLRYQVESTNGFQNALRALVSDSHDVFLLDYVVPGTGLTGIELVQRAHAGGCTSPIILLTQMLDESVHWAALVAGAADVLHKTLDLCPHPDCPLNRSTDSPRRLLARAIRYATQHYQRLQVIQAQLSAVQEQLATVHKKLNRS